VGRGSRGVSPHPNSSTWKESRRYNLLTLLTSMCLHCLCTFLYPSVLISKP
jgi:hypothetical protein